MQKQEDGSDLLQKATRAVVVLAPSHVSIEKSVLVGGPLPVWRAPFASSRAHLCGRGGVRVVEMGEIASVAVDAGTSGTDASARNAMYLTKRAKRCADARRELHVLRMRATLLLATAALPTPLPARLVQRWAALQHTTWQLA